MLSWPLNGSDRKLLCRDLANKKRNYSIYLGNKNKTVKGIKMAADSRSRQPLLEIFDDFKMADEHERPFRGSRHTYSSLQKVKNILQFFSIL
jgi:hypothetical protein